MQFTYSFELTQPNKVANLLAIPAFAVEAQVTVEFEVYGNYRPATWTCPAEYPELEITSFMDLTITFYEESQNIAFEVGTSVDDMATLIDFHRILHQHSADLESTCWETYTERQDYDH
jgi:hypothetical protein